MPPTPGRPPRALAAAAAGLLALAGCAAGGPDSAATADPAPARGLTMAFGGDVMFEAHLAPLAEDPDSLAELAGTLGAADLSVVNLETAVTRGGGAPIPGKPFTFRTGPGALDALARAGVDAVSLANNHAADHGAEGLAETLAIRDSSPVPMAGIGQDAAEAYAPITLTAGGARVALLAGNDLVEETTTYHTAGESTPGIAATRTAEGRRRLAEAVTAAKGTHDLVVVMMHGGVEGTHCPGEHLIDTVDALAAAGADAVISAHNHRVAGRGWVGDTYVHYGLGNFVYYLNRGEAGHTGVLTLDVEIPAADAPAAERHRPRVTGARWTPMLIGGDGIPRPADAATTEHLAALADSYRECTPATADHGG